jgi:hypothetical protein
MVLKRRFSAKASSDSALAAGSIASYDTGVAAMAWASNS